MASQFYGTGRIINVISKSAEEAGTKSNLLELNVSVNTGEPKKDGDEYYPSNIFKITLWGKRADALQQYVAVGKRILFDGDFAVPNVYLDKEGNPKVALKLSNVNKFEILDRRDATESDETEEVPAAKTATKKTSTKAKAAPVADEFEVDDLNFD